MEKWGRGPLGDAGVDFYCICVDTQNVAKLFGHKFQLTKAVNGWIATESDYPSFGQHGCRGFIVIGQDGRCVTRATAALLKVGPEEAFMDVEQVVCRELGPAAPLADVGGIQEERAYAAGQHVTIEGLSDFPELNGVRATIVKFDALHGKFVVEYDETDLTCQPGRPRMVRVSVRPCCLATTASSAAQKPFTSSSSSAGANWSGGRGSSRIECPPSVGHEEIDAEHAACTAALNALLLVAATPEGAGPEHFRAALEALQQHFEHEEALMAAAEAGVSAAGSCSGARAEFSAMKGHAMDHQRILGLAREGERRAREGGKEQRTYKIGAVALEDAQNLAWAFSKHAEEFDTLLEGRLAGLVAY